VQWKRPEDWQSPNSEDALFGAGTMSLASRTERHKAVSESKLLVGTGPGIARRLMDGDTDVHWYLDPEEPDVLWCALGYAYPAWLWVPVEPNAAALAEVLSASHPRPELRLTELTETARGYLGFLDEVDVPHGAANVSPNTIWPSGRS
jgi:hypothetical protein